MQQHNMQMQTQLAVLHVCYSFLTILCLSANPGLNQHERRGKQPSLLLYIKALNPS
jgi:hypothetical protein